MPSKTDKQRRAMAAAAEGNSSLGISKEVGQEYMKADKRTGKHKTRRHYTHALPRRGSRKGY